VWYNDQQRGSQTQFLLQRKDFAVKVIVVHGAPGCGKTTVAGLLHQHLKSPWFEFGWIPEFTWRNPHTEISCRDEERMSFENLMLVTQNYIRHGFENVILSDLNDIRMLDIAGEFQRTPHMIVALLTEDSDLLKQRILAREGENTYKDWPQAQRINGKITAREPLPNEVRIRVDHQSPEEVVARILALLEEHCHREGDLSEYRREEYFSYTD